MRLFVENKWGHPSQIAFENNIVHFHHNVLLALEGFFDVKTRRILGHEKWSQLDRR